MKNIVLTGLRGCGKSKLGKLIANKLGWDFVDIDDEIEKFEGAKIKDIVAHKGWEYFRAAETAAVQRLAHLKQTVIATGGGTIIDPENEKLLKKNGKIIYLYVKPHIAAQRILHSKNRPPLTNQESVEEEIKQLYKERNHRYCESATLIFNRTGKIRQDRDQLMEKLFP